MYDRDSFFDLTPWGQAGLLALSTVLFVAVVFATWALLRRRPPLVRLAGALAVFWLFEWVSPQVYYQYYRLLFEGLPLQWVIWPPPGPVEALELLVFQGPHSLSAHSRGLLGWTLLAVPFLRLPARAA
ncbi:MAG: hypothetical protein AAFV86_00520 [Pseudomonadota bacterium]